MLPGVEVILPGCRGNGIDCVGMVMIVFPGSGGNNGIVVVVADNINGVAVMVGHNFAVLGSVMVVVVSVVLVRVIRGADDLVVDDLASVGVDNRNDLARWLDVVGVIGHFRNIAHDIERDLTSVRIMSKHGRANWLFIVVVVSSGVVLALDLVSHDFTSVMVDNRDDFALLIVDVSVGLRVVVMVVADNFVVHNMAGVGVDNWHIFASGLVGMIVVMVVVIVMVVANDFMIDNVARMRINNGNNFASWLIMVVVANDFMIDNVAGMRVNNGHNLASWLIMMVVVLVVTLLHFGVTVSVGVSMGMTLAFLAGLVLALALALGLALALLGLLLLLGLLDLLMGLFFSVVVSLVGSSVSVSGPLQLFDGVGVVVIVIS